MSTSLPSAGRMDVGHVGMTRDELPPFEDGPLDLASWFGDRRSQPLELEIGSGKGTFLVQQATACAQVNYIGLEYAMGFWRYAADRCRRRAIDNVRLVHIDADLFVRRYSPDRCFQQVHIYFPDPWPKARHNKRRLIQAPFLRELHRVLDVGGAVRIATDHDDYFQWMIDHVAQVSDLFERVTFESPDSAGEDELVGTNFERKYRREGRPFNAMILKRQ